MGNDSIALSEEAKLKAELLAMEEEVKLSPAVREERIVEIKRRLEDPNYIDETIVASVAERVMDLFKL